MKPSTFSASPENKKSTAAFSAAVRILLCLLPFAAFALGLLLRDWVIRLSKLLPPCGLRWFCGLYCPGCGITRSVDALLHLNLAGSLHANPLVLFALAVGAAGYLQLLLRAFGRPVRLVPKAPAFWITCAVLLAAFFVLRKFFPVLAP